MAERVSHTEVRPVSGFMTPDGRFFEKRGDAQLAHTETQLREALPEKVNRDRFLEIINDCYKEVTAYLVAYTVAAAAGRTPEVNTSVNGAAEEGDDTLLE